jgi:UrcA family protein
MIKRTIAAMIGTALIAAPAFAQNVESLTVSIKTADLDLASAQGRARLDRRVRQAAGQICGADEPRSIAMREAFTRCRAEVLSDADVKIAAMARETAPIQVARRGN